MPARTLGVEEELMLVDPDTGRLRSVSHLAVHASEAQATVEAEAEAEVEHELFLQQIETSTKPCLEAEDLAAGVRQGRRAVGEAAAAAGARAVAVPTPVLLEEADERFTPKPRYQRIHAEYGELARQALVCAMHVHVEVADDDEAVHVVDRVRPWLPVLVALSANSPYWQGRDTGHASWRSQVWSRWPTAGAAQPFGDVATYRRAAEAMVDWGGALDPGMLYFDVRLSEKYPTVEIRVADVTTDVEDAVLVALLARALVTTAAADPDLPGWRADLLQVAGWRAARFGMAGSLVHPVEAVLVPAREAFGALVAHVRPALEEAGDLQRVTESFERLAARGTGAARQRSVFEATRDLGAVVADLARRTEESWA
jgi:glutamate---cysteine ligase / carboxylate-amine ligase